MTLRIADILPIHESDVAAAGWDKQRLDDAFRLAQNVESTTLVVMTHGKYVKTMGDLRKTHRVHSVRKALLSALVGQHVGTGPGKIDLDKTLEELGIDDHPQPLTQLQGPIDEGSPLNIQQAVADG